MTSKQIIDIHFSERYNYYRTVCLRISEKDTEVYENLLHDTYFELLKVKAETVMKFHAVNKLHFIGIRVIKGLYAKRFRTKRTIKGSTSDLFIAIDSFFRIDRPFENYGRMIAGMAKKKNGGIIQGYDPDEDNHAVELKSSNEDLKYTEEDFIVLESAINTLLYDPDKTIGVHIFLQVNETSISELSKNSGINRYYITQKYNKGKEDLKNHIENEKRNNTGKTGDVKPCQVASGSLQILDQEKRKVTGGNGYPEAYRAAI